MILTYRCPGCGRELEVDEEVDSDYRTSHPCPARNGELTKFMKGKVLPAQWVPLTKETKWLREELKGR